MVLATHDLGPVPHLPINEIPEVQAAVESTLMDRETADLDDKQTEADVEKPGVAQVAAEGGTNTMEDNATAAMLLATKNTHDLGPAPHLPINKVPEDQAAEEGHLLKDLIKPGGVRKPKTHRSCPRKVPPTEQILEDQAAVNPP